MSKVHSELKRRFWKQFIQTKIEGYENIYESKNATSNNGIGQETKLSGVSVYVNLNLNKINVTLVIHSNSIEESKNIFEFLEQKSHELQKDFSERIFWKKKPFIRRIAVITKHELRYDKQSDWDEINTWLITTSYLLKKSAEAVLDSYDG